MIHVILNTGQVDVVLRADCSDQQIAEVRPFLTDGWHQLPHDGWQLHSTPGVRSELLFTVHHGDAPVMNCGVAPTDAAADALWPILERFYLDLTDRPPWSTANWAPPSRPEKTPWLVSVLVAPPDVFGRAKWLGDFERVMAWAWLEHWEG